MSLTTLDIIKNEFDLNEDQKKEIVDGVFSEITPEKLPSRFSKDFDRLMNSFVLRKVYTTTIGFALLSQEFANELHNILFQYGIRTFVELEAGNGSLTILLNNIIFDGKGYTLKPCGGGKHWGFNPDNKFCQQALKNNMLEFKDIRNVKIDNNIDLIVASWIPYQEGEEVIEFFKNNSKNIPEYFLLIGEDEGGCTAGDEFFEWLCDNFDRAYTFKQYMSFNAIYDECILYKRKK
jgi:hypothetical protein